MNLGQTTIGQAEELSELELYLLAEEVDMQLSQEDYVNTGALEAVVAMCEEGITPTMKTCLLNDVEFATVFGTDESTWQETAETHIAEEGQKIQDLFRWSIEGVIIGKYLRSFKRMRSKLTTLSNTMPVAIDLKARKYSSQYLLPVPQFNETMDACDEIIKLLEAINKSGGKLDVNKAIKLLGTFKIKAEYNTKTQWSLIGGSILAGMIGSATRIPFLGLLGNIFGKGIFSDQGRGIANNGWDGKSVVAAAERVLDHLTKFQSIEKMFKTLPMDDLDFNTYKMLNKTVKSAVKGYKDILAYNGRGLSAVKY